MTTELIVYKATDGVPAQFKSVIADKKIAELQKAYGGLVVSDVDDPEQVKAVREARLIVRQPRIAVDKLRKDLKADSLAYGRAVEAEAKRLMTPLQELEARLQAEEDKVKEHKERIRRERIDARMSKLRAVDCNDQTEDMVDGLSDEMFESVLAGKTAIFEKKKEEERLAEEARQVLAARQVRMSHLKHFIPAAELQAMTPEEFEAECAAVVQRQQEQAEERAREEAKRELVYKRMDELSSVGGTLPMEQIESLSEEAFASVLNDFRKAKEAADRKRQEEEVRLREERKRLDAEKAEEDLRRAAEQAELDRQRKEIADREATLKAEQDRLAREERERLDAERREKEEAERKDREAAEAEAERLRQEQMKPVREKIQSYIEAVAAVGQPDIEDPMVVAKTAQAVGSFIDNLKRIASEL